MRMVLSSRRRRASSSKLLQTLFDTYCEPAGDVKQAFVACRLTVGVGAAGVLCPGLQDEASRIGRLRQADSSRSSNRSL